MALEKSIQGSILKYLNSLEGCVAENVWGNAFQKDRPDINCCYDGKLYRIEVKSPDSDNKPTKGQLLNLKKWARARAVCAVVWSLDEVKYLIANRGIYGTDFTGWYITREGQIFKGRYEDEM